MADSRSPPIFVILTAGNCGHCVTFKDKYLDDLEDRIANLEDNNEIRFLHAKLDTVSDKPDPNLTHPKLSGLLGWFPQFILITGDTWDDHSGKLDGQIFGGVLEKGVMKKGSDGRPVTVKDGKIDDENIYNWITKNLATPKFSQNVQSTAPNHSQQRDDGYGLRSRSPSAQTQSPPHGGRDTIDGTSGGGSGASGIGASSGKNVESRHVPTVGMRIRLSNGNISESDDEW